MLRAAKKLVAAGILREDGTVDYAAALEVLALATRDEYFKQAVLRFTVENFRKDLRRMLGLGLAHVTLKWDPGFEEFLCERRKKKVTDSETVTFPRLTVSPLAGLHLCMGSPASPTPHGRLSNPTPQGSHLWRGLNPEYLQTPAGI